MLRDPVCGQRVNRGRAYARIEHEHVLYYLCCPRCQAEFEAEPGTYARPELGERVTRSTMRQAVRQPHNRA
jgi:YHS domain-containing protein